MIYNCPVCGGLIASWIVGKEKFECPGCKAKLVSNSNKAFRKSLVVAVVVWLVFFVGMRQYSGSWGVAAALSIEVGGMVSAMLAALYYHFVVYIRVKSGGG